MELCDLANIERKLELYREMFNSIGDKGMQDLDRDPNWIPLESLQIELIAGGLNFKQQHYILSRLKPNHLGKVFVPITSSFSYLKLGKFSESSVLHDKTTLYSNNLREINLKLFL